MKTRIRETIKGDGDEQEVLYKAEFKDRLFGRWCSVQSHLFGWDLSDRAIEGALGAQRGTLDYAKRMIDRLLAQHAIAEKKALVEKNKQVRFIRYP